MSPLHLAKFQFTESSIQILVIEDKPDYPCFP
jgi:hypothetical protein